MVADGFVGLRLRCSVSGLYSRQFTLIQCGEELVAVVGGLFIGLRIGFGGFSDFVEQVFTQEGQILTDVR